MALAQARTGWRDYWFAPADLRTLTLFRVLYCLSLAFVHVLQLGRIESLYASGLAVYFPTPLFEWLGLGQPPLPWVRGAGLLLTVSLLLAAAGYRARLSLAAASIGFFLFYGTVLGFEKALPNSLSPYTLHYNNICVFVLVILAVAPGIGTLTFRARPWWRQGASTPSHPPSGPQKVPAWPLLLIKWTLALAYFGAGYTKLKAGGLSWADGHTLQAYLLGKFLQEDAWYGFWLAQDHAACLILSVLTLLLELTFPLVPLLGNRHPVTWLFVAAGLTFHLLIHLTMRITHFLPFLGLTYFVFLDRQMIDRLTAFAGRSHTPAPAPAAAPTPAPDPIPRPDRPPLSAPSRQTRSAALFMTAYLGLHLGCIVGGVEAWPFTDYRVFAKRAAFSDIRVGRLQLTDARGTGRWLQPGDMGPGFEGYYDGTDFNRFYLYQSGRPPFGPDAQDILARFLDRLPPQPEGRIRRLAYVVRTIEQTATGGFVPRDLELFDAVKSVPDVTEGTDRREPDPAWYRTVPPAANGRDRP